MHGLPLGAVLVLMSACTTDIEVVLQSPGPDERLAREAPQVNLVASVLSDGGNVSDTRVVLESEPRGELMGLLSDRHGQVFGQLPPVGASGPQTLTLTAFHPSGTTATDQVTVQVNHPPGPATVLEEHVRVAADDSVDITALHGPATDLDGDDITYRYAWTRSGGGVANVGEVLPADMTQRGELWTASIETADLFDQGSAVTVQVQINSLPGPAGVALQPPRPRVGQDALQCLVETPAVDVNGDPVTHHVTWTLDGQPYPASFPATEGPTTTDLPDDTLPPADLSLAGEVTCTVIANDGLEDGEPASVSVVLGRE